MEENKKADDKIQKEKREVEALEENLQKIRKNVEQIGSAITITEKQKQGDLCVAKSLLANGNKCLQIVIKKGDFKYFKVVNTTLSSRENFS